MWNIVSMQVPPDNEDGYCCNHLLHTLVVVLEDGIKNMKGVFLKSNTTQAYIGVHIGHDAGDSSHWKVKPRWNQGETIGFHNANVHYV